VNGSPRATRLSNGHRLAFAAALASLTAAALTAPDLSRGALCLAPCVALALLLLFDRYTGERLIVRAASRRRRGRRPAERLPAPPPVALERPYVGRLICAAASPRAPPARRWWQRPIETTSKGPALKTRQAVIALAAAALMVPAAAQAHVSLHPNVLPSGDFPTVNIRVPNETDNARTVKVDVKIPPGFTALDPQQVPGWKIKLVKTKLAKPIQTDDGPVTEEVSEVIFTVASGGGTPPGYIENFPIAFSVPGKSGDTLTFKTVQTYSNGQVVRWIGTPDADKPAPTVNVGPKNGSTYDLAGDAGPPAGQVAPAAAAGGGKSSAVQTRTVVQQSSGASKGLAITALVVGILGLLAGLAALVTRRRNGRTAPELSKEVT
jgi:uncharacterized protein